MKGNIVVSSPNHLNVNWAKKIIDQHTMDAKVYDVDIKAIDVGTTTRVRLHVEHNKTDTLPKQWFVKFPSLSYRARLITALPRLLHTEVRFYQEIAPTIPVSKPLVLAGQSKLGRGATLVLSDVTESGAIPGCPSDNLTVRQTETVIRQLATFHACFWDRVKDDPNYFWLASSVRRLEDNLGAILAGPLMKRGLKLAGSLVPKAIYEPVMHYAKNRKKAMQFLTNNMQTLIHHDCHPGNLFWNHVQPGFLDWQMIRIGEGVSDISYLLGTALEPKARKNHEHALLKLYQHFLLQKGIVGLELKTLEQRYRAHLAYAFEAMILTLAVGGLMPLESNLELIDRTVRAVEENDAFSQLAL
jgi:Ecdysteroid kinase-like family